MATACTQLDWVKRNFSSNKTKPACRQTGLAASRSRSTGLTSLLGLLGRNAALGWQVY